jgi:hypothetical protein
MHSLSYPIPTLHIGLGSDILQTPAYEIRAGMEFVELLGRARVISTRDR